MTWPNLPNWFAGKNNITFDIAGKTHTLWIQQCGNLEVPSGKLVACDPFDLMGDKKPYILVPKGRFPVFTTLVDVSEEQDKSDVRIAYASIEFQEGQEAYREILPLVKEGQECLKMEKSEYVGFEVDSGTACFVDDQSLEIGMLDESDCQPWENLGDLIVRNVFDNGRPNCWIKLQNDPNHLREGIANIILPKAKKENVIIFSAGWGDGCYPLVGSFDENNNLLSVHIDFFVIPFHPESLNLIT